MPPLEEAFRIAVDHHRTGRLAEAAYESILAAVPDQPEAMSNLGFAQQMQGKLSAATYRKVLAFEISRRLELLGEREERTLGPLLHLSHARSTNSVTENPWYAHNATEYKRIVSMTPGQVRREIAAGGFRRPLVSARTAPGLVAPPAS